MTDRVMLAFAVEQLDVIYLNIWAILISLANLVILFLILKKFLFKPVTRVVSERREKANRLISDAEEAKAAAEADKAAYEARMGQAEEDAAEVVRRAQEVAGRRGEEIIGGAEKRAAAIRKQAEADIAQEKKKALNDLKGEISEISLSIAEQVVGREVKPEDHHALVDGLIADIGDRDE